MPTDLDFVSAVGAVILGLPLATFLLVELERLAAGRQPEIAGFLRLLQSTLLPVLAAWTILTWIADIDPEGLTAKLADTALAIILVHAGLQALQLLLLAFADSAKRAPKLLIDLGRLLLVAVGAAVVISRVWDLDLGQLVAALGVGSLVLGLALQNVIGGLVGGLVLLSSRPFTIGDVVRLGDKVARVVQIDWRMVTLDADGERLLVPSSELSGRGITLIAPPGNPRVVEIMLGVSYLQSPEAVRAAILEAARDIACLAGPDGAHCHVAAYDEKVIRYLVTLRLTDPLALEAARDELLSRLWYVAQRRGIRLGPHADSGRDEAERAAIRERVAQAARSSVLSHAGLPIEDIAAIARIERYRPAEAVVMQGRANHALLLVLDGEAIVSVELRGERIVIEHLGEGDLHATRSTFRGEPSPVRVEALGELTVLSLPLSHMGAILAASPSLARDIESVLEARGQALAKVAGRDTLPRVAA